MRLEVDRERNFQNGDYNVYIQGPDGTKSVVARTDDWERTYLLMRVVKDTISAVQDFLPKPPQEEEEDL